MLDLLVRNGLVIDGTGNPGFYAAVGVQGEEVRVLRGNIDHVEAARVIDASDHVVSPGFIDMHSHGGLVILGDPRHEPKVRQGVTTELIGIDGNSVAPFKTEDDLHHFIELDSGLNGKPPMPAQWSTVAEYLSMYDDKVAVNICYILGNSPVRIWSVGWNDRPATEEELEDMKAVVREAMQEGAFGLSTGLDYPPGAYADTNELIELSRVAAEMGGLYHTHTRASLRQKALLAPWEEALEIGREGRDSGASDPLPAGRPGRGEPPGLPGPRRERAGGGYGRHLRLLPLRLFEHPRDHRHPQLGEGWRPRPAQKRPQ